MRELAAYDALYAAGTIGFERDSRFVYMVLAKLHEIANVWSSKPAKYVSYADLFPLEDRMRTGRLHKPKDGSVWEDVWKYMGGR